MNVSTARKAILYELGAPVRLLFLSMIDPESRDLKMNIHLAPYTDLFTHRAWFNTSMFPSWDKTWFEKCNACTDFVEDGSHRFPRLWYEHMDGFDDELSVLYLRRHDNNMTSRIMEMNGTLIADLPSGAYTWLGSELETSMSMKMFRTNPGNENPYMNMRMPTTVMTAKSVHLTAHRAEGIR
ncbi:hypothetical protein AYL99_11602 [Fonsecaea erecta]|uniref:Uncharacterized protein n=1 Tax=Fonsecaea erecta TaxID=1367422 RepID=A0A178Z2N2_9EURO|nr:hypothetical protein AYL99_11602 [Fonsecaea erecta]OAP54068.1 hypothetical protein AYL99_11602 [Fonsecaea erecta]